MYYSIEEEFENVKRNKKFTSPLLLNKYLDNIYMDLSAKTKQSNERFLPKICFLDFMRLPSIISDNLYRIFDKDDIQRLSYNNFELGMSRILNGTLEDLIKVIYELCDFDNDGFVYLEDIRLILKHVDENSGYLSEFERFVKSSDLGKDNFDEDDFIHFTKNCSVVTFLIKLILNGIPINVDSANIFKLENGKKDDDEEDPITEKSLMTHMTIFIDEEPEDMPVFNLAESDGENAPSDDEILNTIRVPVMKSLHRLISLKNNSNRSTTDTIKEEKENSNFNKNLESVIDKDYYKIDSLKKLKFVEDKIPPKDFQINILNTPRDAKTSSLKNTNSPKSTKFKRGKTLKSVKFKVSDKFKFDSLVEGFVYKLTSNNTLRKFWITFINNDIFYFNSARNKFKGMHNLANCYAEMGTKDTFNDKEYYSFDYIFKNRRRTYYCETQTECLNWVTSLWKVTNFRDITEYYDIFEKLGKGQFGEVKLGIDKNTNAKVAIKVINKTVLKQHEAEAIRLEAEILSKCKHPNIVSLIDKFETCDTIYLVLEYLSGGDLTSYLMKQVEIISEDQIKQIVLELAKGLKYLSNLGIIHRDLKPDNLMFGDNVHLKIVDFGLSRIVGYKMKVYEESGTLAYVAPEVIQGKGYNIEIDMWSLGIIIYYLISGKLPFDDVNKDPKVISGKISRCEVAFPSQLWGSVSQPAIDLTKKCLSEQRLRITIDQFIKHPWFKS